MNVNRLALEIITPDRVMVSQEVDMVEAPGTSGEFGVLPGHVAYLATIDCGEVRFLDGNTTRFMATSGGYAEVVEDKVTLLLETAEFAENIDGARARRAAEKAESILKRALTEDQEYLLAEAALRRAIARISSASRIAE
jgi:F-type H+-transporting ATPase subunit epsilon